MDISRKTGAAGLVFTQILSKDKNLKQNPVKQLNDKKKKIDINFNPNVCIWPVSIKFKRSSINIQNPSTATGKHISWFS